MTCQELRSYLQEIERAEPEDQSRFIEIAAHTGICAACGRFVEEQRELATDLRVLRESAPDVPASLDASVLASYRSLAAQEVSLHRLAGPRMSLIAAVAWTAALAAAVIIANEELRFFVPTEEAPTNANRAAAPQAQTEGQSSDPITTIPKEITTRSAHPAIARKRLRKPAAVPQRTMTSVLSEAADANDSQPVEFRGLMYCDELSCGGPMEMIRVQLPPSAARLMSGPAASNEVVYADVLVGADGIARGIRILK